MRIFVRALLLPLLALSFSFTARAAEDDAPTLDVILAALDSQASMDGKVVYVDFWASWCGPCRTSFPWMQRMSALHTDEGLAFITVNVDRKSEAARHFMKEMHATLPVIDDPEGKLAEQFHLAAMPTAFIFDRSGTLRLRHEGFRQKDTEELESLLTELLAEKPPVAGAEGATP